MNEEVFNKAKQLINLKVPTKAVAELIKKSPATVYQIKTTDSYAAYKARQHQYLMNKKLKDGGVIERKVYTTPEHAMSINDKLDFIMAMVKQLVKRKGLIL